MEVFMKKILIIGGTGTISLPVTKKLSSIKENEVYVLNRGNKNVDLPENVHTIQGNINDTKQMKKFIADKLFDTVINFIVWNKADAEQNIEIFSGHVKQFIYISTVAVLNRELTCNINENTASGNMYSAYGQNKLEAEHAFTKEYEKNDFPITIVRPTQTYSKERIPLSVKGKSCWSVIDRMLEGKPVIVHGDGQSVWASTHAEDFAEGFYLLVGNKETIGETYQIMNPESHTWDMVYQELADLLNVDYKPVYIGTDLLKESKEYDLMQSIQGDKRWSSIFDIEKNKTVNPDFKCKVSLREGLKNYLDYMENHPEKKIKDEKFDHWCDHTIASYTSFKSTFVKEI